MNRLRSLTALHSTLFVLCFLFVNRWTEAETCKFVRLYKQRECLWNSGLQEYRNNKLRQDAYEDIQKEMNLEGFTVNDVRQKIKNLRNTYTQEVAKIEKSINLQQDPVYCPAVKWFKTMDELVTKVKENQPSVYFREKSQQAQYNSEQATKEEPQSLGDFEMGTVESEIDIEETVFQEQPSAYCQSYINQAPSPVPPVSDGASRKKRRAVINSALHKLEQVNQSLQEFLEAEDDFDAFGNFIALSLKKLPLDIALEAQTEIQDILIKFRRMHLNASGAETRTQHRSRPLVPSERPPTESTVTFFMNEHNAVSILDHE